MNLNLISKMFVRKRYNVNRVQKTFELALSRIEKYCVNSGSLPFQLELCIIENNIIGVEHFFSIARIKTKEFYSLLP